MRVVNRNDERLQIRGNIQLNQIPGPTVEPVNFAYAYSSCTNCQTVAVALQINLISRTANRVTPQNAAVAINERCNRCITVARALQYTYSVDDPTQVPREVSDLIREMDRTIQEIGSSNQITIPEAESRLNAVIGQFVALATSLNDQRHEDTSDDTGTPTPTGGPASGTAVPTATLAGSTTGTPTPAPTVAPTATPLPTATSLPPTPSPAPTTSP